MISAREFAKALQQLPKPTEKQRLFLTAHVHAAARTSTATILANAAGYATYGGINLQYGKLALAVARVLGIPGNPGFGLIVDFVRPKKVTNDHWLLMMKPEFAEALVTAGWVDKH